MKKILCYGDSNTFGYNPKDGSRFDKETRWTAILQKMLGQDYKIMEEGACDRTGFVSNPKGDLFSAQEHFIQLMSSINNIDILILSIGTNDLQFQYDIDFGTVEKGLEKLVKVAKQKTSEIILIPPVVLNENILDGYFKIQFDKSSILKSKDIGIIYKNIANKYDLKFFDINEFASPSEQDGLHYDKTAHKLIAQRLSEFILLIEGYKTI